jgi:hypothetical protein
VITPDAPASSCALSRLAAARHAPEQNLACDRRPSRDVSHLSQRLIGRVPYALSQMPVQSYVRCEEKKNLGIDVPVVLSLP